MKPETHASIGIGRTYLAKCLSFTFAYLLTLAKLPSNTSLLAKRQNPKLSSFVLTLILRIASIVRTELTEITICQKCSDAIYVRDKDNSCCLQGWLAGIGFDCRDSK
jgi:hypothetical protein